MQHILSEMLFVTLPMPFTCKMFKMKMRQLALLHQQIYDCIAVKGHYQSASRAVMRNDAGQVMKA